MVAQLKSAVHSPPEAAVEASVPSPVRGQTYLLVAIHGKRDGMSAPEVSGSFVVGEGLDEVRQHAQRLLQRHMSVERVSVLDAEGGMLLGVASRSGVGWQAPQYPRLAFH
jgi:hypothetical protein